ncbi:MAG: phytanoyl-CoA dioxygenase [Aeromicrobium sp.]|jgi:ectoine hydroxylase-related dioxygenase (phytanoyl-CoA dioxygenase family)|uniref:phytanoyl-CoA dioxygenase family protein n=1 Tax=Aeromicrobium sp. TaxID=1871063 RepID=UPI00261A2063|nr:phytanoyl-CoA dioxygenase family protein [Aeromicrobium sp.]MCW2789017.1 phytanoyl-CoA dioxygenase [Aeromicrobium sp.]MCW2825563.1 phytanoyl-CoA dioxygenase [Aeromicrobium sp.]
MTSTLHGSQARPARLREDDCRLDDFAAVVEATTDAADYPFAARVDHDVLVYEAAALRPVIADPARREDVEAELVRALSDGPGIVVLAGAFDDHAVVDRVTAVFDEIIEAERLAGTAPGDHFAKPGANSRVWNALEKLAVRDPEAFVDYYANDLLALISRSWLGPGYQITSQVNVVRPGGVAQDPHRDYHLGFLANDVVEQYPTHVHLLSPVLTLQGAVAHSDMPVESGPTMYLPHSHKYAPGYLAWRRPEFRAYFAEHHVQLPLAKGDAAFFNPAVFHGAGNNVSADVQRMANLLQVSSGFGRAMEAVDRARVSRSVYPVLAARQDAGADPGRLANAIAATAEGYPFPTNLDLDQPIDGLTPLSQAEILHQALDEGWPASRVDEALAGYADRRRTDG